MNGIQRSRGVSIRLHPKGFRVVMYKDSPGEYLDERGEPLSAEVAEAAGFPVNELAKEREKNARMAEFKKKLDRDFASEEQRIAEALSTEGKLKVKRVGGGQYAIYNGDTRVTHTAMNKTEAAELIKQLSGDEGSEGKADDGNAQE